VDQCDNLGVWAAKICLIALVINPENKCIVDCFETFIKGQHLF